MNITFGREICGELQSAETKEWLVTNGIGGYASEKMLIINGLQKRFDILVYDENTKPFLIVECKSPKIKITDDEFRQASVYNFELQAPYLVVCNGLETYCCKMDYVEKTFEFLENLPVW